MIAYIEGRVVETTETGCILFTSGGVGYELFLPSHTLSRLPERGAEARLYVCTVVREDALELFGFETWDERQTFLVLTAISRVGARTAMAILSVFRPDDLRRMVADDDGLALTRVSGIGKKTGQQIFLDLKYKLKGKAQSLAPAGEPKSAGLREDALAALANLGYAEEESLPVVNAILAQGAGRDVGEVLRLALKALGRRKA